MKSDPTVIEKYINKNKNLQISMYNEQESEFDSYKRKNSESDDLNNPWYMYPIYSILKC